MKIKDMREDTRNDKGNLFETLGLMIDCSRDAVMRPDAVRSMLDLMAKMDYNMLMLYTEDTYEVRNQPYFGHQRGRYTAGELRELDDYAASLGISLVPCIQTLAHLNALMRWPMYKEIRDCDDILCVGDDRVYGLIDDMFASVSECFRSRTVNVGMDEAFMLGRGAYMRRNGYRDRMDILSEHLDRVSRIAKRYGLTLLMWSDMFLRISDEEGSDKAAGAIPDNVRPIHWDYYHTDGKIYDAGLERNLSIRDDVWFAGGIWTWTGFAPHDTFSLNVSRPAVKSCVSHGIKHIFFTMWGDDGGECSRFAALPAVYAASRYAKGIFDENEIREGFGETVGISWDDFMLLELPETLNTDAESPSGNKSVCPNNPDKYMLYCDCLMGLFDGKVLPGDADAYGRCAARLKRLECDPVYGHLFRTASRLCDVLALKIDIGNRTRRAYREGRDALREILPDYDELIARTEDFRDAFERQWMTENKPQGFEVHDIRIGGLIGRMRHVRMRLCRYTDGSISRIEELEEPVLDVSGNPDAGREPFHVSRWSDMATVSPI